MQRLQTRPQLRRQILRGNIHHFLQLLAFQRALELLDVDVVHMRFRRPFVEVQLQLIHALLHGAGVGQCQHDACSIGLLKVMSGLHRDVLRWRECAHFERVGYRLHAQHVFAECGGADEIAAHFAGIGGRAVFVVNLLADAGIDRNEIDAVHVEGVLVFQIEVVTEHAIRDEYFYILVVFGLITPGVAVAEHDQHFLVRVAAVVDHLGAGGCEQAACSVLLASSSKGIINLAGFMAVLLARSNTGSVRNACASAGDSVRAKAVP